MSLPPAEQVHGLKFLVFDADARPVRVGDRLEFQQTSGRYGETRRGCGTVLSAEVQCGWVVTDGGLVSCEWEWHPPDGPEGLYCRGENHDPEHAHRTWARIIDEPNGRTAAGHVPDAGLLGHGRGDLHGADGQ